MSTDRTLTPFFEGGTYFECPRWHDGRWWASDFYRGAVHSYGPDGAETVELEVPQQPSGLGWLPGGDLLVVSMRDHRILRRDAAGTVTTHADLTGLAAGHVNDMVVTPDGHAYVGCFGFDLMGGGTPQRAPLLHVTPDGEASVAAEDLWFPNGMAIAGDTLIVAETLGSQLSAFTIGADGALADRRVWAQPAPPVEPTDMATVLAQATFAPDGITLDAEGFVWAANAVGGSVDRVAEGGGIVDSIPMPEGLGTFACMLGGPDGRTLMICAAPDFYEEARKVATEGVLLVTTV